MEEIARNPALVRLDALAGDWYVDADFPGHPEIKLDRGRCTFEWILNGAFLVQKQHLSDPIPDCTAILAYDSWKQTYTYHYFDTRRIIRIFEMSFDGRIWDLMREKADFSPLPFSQRIHFEIEDGGDTIHGVGDRTNDSGKWERDINLVNRRVR
jgi:hypothetical protein